MKVNWFRVKVLIVFFTITLMIVIIWGVLNGWIPDQREEMLNPSNF
jgi:hypothetical protein